MTDQQPTNDPTSGWPGAPGTPGAPPPAGYPPAGGYPPAPAYQPNVPAPGYGYPYSGGYGGYTVPREHPQGTTILVLGILGLVACQLLGIVAWIMGNKAIKEIDANPAAYSNRGNVQAGRICGIVATCLFVLVIGIYAAFIIAIAVGSASS